MTNQRFEALSRICLNNWHYIKQKTLSFSEGINFFTGHSGSGKSTVIDALQIVLYANTDGRGFFNKAAADDSDRNLIEYLRGMVNIGENNEFKYLRNNNFSTTIVLELEQTDTKERQCVGVVFDVETATNEISRMFFRHSGPLPDHEYRTDSRAMTIEEVRSYIQHNYQKDDIYYGSNNERFRKQLYDVYLGGLDSEKFPQLFKRAIPFKMNIKLEEFVKEYICMEQNIHIEDMQESVMQYGRMRKKIEDTCNEIEQLEAMKVLNDEVTARRLEKEQYRYFGQKMDLLHKKLRVDEQGQKIEFAKVELVKNKELGYSLQIEIDELTARSEELLKQISNTGYEELKNRLADLNQLVERLEVSKGNWSKVSKGLEGWSILDITSNQTNWDIEEFTDGTITEETLRRLQKNLESMRKEVEEQRSEILSDLKSLKREDTQKKEELEQLKTGGKAYPKEIEQARTQIQKRLSERVGKVVSVDILADLIDIKDDSWRNAVEGYLAGNKLSLIVEPKYARDALEVYQELDKAKFHRVAVVDTEKVAEDHHIVLKGALSEEVQVEADHIQAYINFLLGKVMKCDSIEELRNSKIGITKDCVLYHSYRIKHINPEEYTKFAYIGRSSIRSRIRLLEEQLKEISVQCGKLELAKAEYDGILKLEHLSEDTSTYFKWREDMEQLQTKEKEQSKLRKKLEELKASNIDEWEKERQNVIEQQKEKQKQLNKVNESITLGNSALESEHRYSLDLLEELTTLEKQFVVIEDMEEAFAKLLLDQSNIRYDRGKMKYEALANTAEGKQMEQFNRLIELRLSYLKKYPNRNFSPTIEHNQPYEELLQVLQVDNLEAYRKKAGEQARAAVEHFKDDFMFKIRSAIKEAIQRKDELNRIISKLDFGKDKYQFVIGKNKGPDGQFYDMFMDESLEVNPAHLDMSVENQMNLFTMKHENNYGEMINELINIFIPPDNASSEQLEEAKRNMDRYADYRTYLSFDMQQIIKNEEETIKIGLSKMIKKNSGGEGQNPLYVALLASFAQAYRINMSSRIQRNPTIRLVVLDEAFSKMDSEKVASCIELIRGLGFQALISATNDKIQNYIENVDRIFVYANPNKKSISIQEFERKDFKQLSRDLEDEEYIEIE